MKTIYICTDCGCEHHEPAGADYLLAARCFDCTHVAAIAARPATHVTSSTRAQRRRAA